MSISVKNWSDVHCILTSNALTKEQKINYVRNNKTKIGTIIKQEISAPEFKELMKERPLPKFRPVKNYLTKQADKKLLANSLNIKYNAVDEYISNFCTKLTELDKLTPIDKNNAEKLKSYVFRHGKKDEVVLFLDYELFYAKDVLQTLYSTLRYDMDGVADYFKRPIHRMDNKTLVDLYAVIDKHLTFLEKHGDITTTEKEQSAKWALATIYKIQNNSKLIQAVKIYNRIE